MTYNTCVRVIEIAVRKGIVTEEWISGMKEKFDVLLLNNRLTTDEYTGLMTLLSTDEGNNVDTENNTTA